MNEFMARPGVLFLCVANSSRSQMAEGFARTMAPPDVEVFSAGSAPTTVNPNAVAVMAEVGIDISNHRSKAIDDVPKARIGTVITLCAEEVCPVFPGDVRRLHWPLDDPAITTGSEEAVLRVFRLVRDEISSAVREYFDGQSKDTKGES